MSPNKKEKRACPVCHNTVNRSSKRCDHCGATMEKEIKDIKMKKDKGTKNKGSKNRIFRDFVERWEKIEGSTEHKLPKKRCPLCDVKLRIPPLKCKKCRKYYEVDDLARTEEGMPRCSSCDSPVELCSERDLKTGVKLEKCRECGYRFRGEEGILGNGVSEDTPVKAKEDTLSELEDLEERLEEELADEIIKEDEVEEVQEEIEVEEFECPECGETVDSQSTKCPGCGVPFVDFDELPDGLIDAAEIIGSKNEGEKEQSDSDAEEIMVEEFECPICSGVVSENDSKCPNCGIEFTDFEETSDLADKSALEELEKLIEETASDLGRSTGDALGVSAKKDDTKVGDKPQFTDSDLDSLLDELDITDFTQPLEDVQRPRNINTCSLCNAKITPDVNFCPECGMLNTDLNELEEEQIADFVQRIKSVVKVMKAPNKEEEIKSKLKAIGEKISQNLMDEELWFQRGLLLSKVGSYKKAIKSFETVSSLNPKHKRIWVAKANVLSQLGMNEEASQCYKKALDIISEEYPKKRKTPPVVKKRPVSQSAKKSQLPEKIEPGLGLTNGITPKERGMKNGMKKGKDGLANGLTIGMRKGRSGLTNGLSNGMKRGRGGLTNGLSNDMKRGRDGLTNGLSNGMKRGRGGLTNGLTNGMKRGRGGLTKGLSNGIKRGKGGLTNGLTNGMKRGRGGLTNGLSNGLTNGLTSGLKKGKLGVTNGLTNGLTNGVTNGITNGLTNGLRALKVGISHGITNGNGITNGLGPSRGLLEGKNTKLRVVMVVGIVLLLTIAPYLFNFTNTPPESINIDGKFGDWQGITTSSDVTESSPFNPNVDIVDYRIDSRQMDFSFYLKVEGTMLAGEPGGGRLVDTAYIFIDSDRDSQTGFFIRGMGADYMLQIYGWDQEILKSLIFYYEGNQQDWNMWKEMGNIPSAVYDSELEVQISMSTIFRSKHDIIDVLFYMQSWDGFDDFSDTLISNQRGVLIVAQQGVSEDMIEGDGNRLLKIELEAISCDIVLNELTAKRTGVGTDSDIEGIRLEDGSGNSVAIGAVNNGNVTFKPDISFSEGKSSILYVVVDMASSAKSENSIGFRIENINSVITNKGVVTLRTIKRDEELHDNSYILSIPDNITIDGAFADWAGKFLENDTYDDVVREDLDILRYGVSNTEDGAAFYLNVDGEICGGMTVPFWNKQAKRDPILGVGGEPGEPPELPPRTGEDVIYIFIDTISQNGYKGDLPLNADYLIEIKGWHNKILSRTYYEWSGALRNQWDWTQIGTVDAQIDTQRMEVAIKWDDIDIDPAVDDFDVFFWATDWQKGVSDYSDGPPVSGPRGTRAMNLEELITGLGKSKDEKFGWNVSYAGDVNGDGYPDIIVGAPYHYGKGFNDIITADSIADTITIYNGTSDNDWETIGTLGAGNGARSIFVGDANNDGFNDILTADEFDNTLSIYNGTSSGNWDTKYTLTTGTNPYSIFVGDANNDGYNDILIADYGDDTVSIFNGSSGGGWEARGTLSVGGKPYSVFVADANNDGYNDVLTADYNDNTVSLYNGTSGNVWEVKSTFDVGWYPYSVYVGDANNDGYNDILSADYGDDKVSIFNGTSSGSWEAKGTLSVGNAPISVFVGDANNDGYNDVLTSDYSDKTVSVLNGTSNGVWESRTTLGTGTWPRGLYVGDANNDGYNDVLTSDLGDYTVTIHNGTSSGGWEAKGSLDVGDGPMSVFVADANNDGQGGRTGAAYIFFGYPGISTSDIHAANANVTIYGSNAGDYFGWDVSDAGNVNGDSYDDIIIGAPGYGTDKGRAYIFYGRATGSWSSVDDADTDSDVNITGENDYDKFGHSVSAAGNFDNSSDNDTIVGAPNAAGWWNPNWNFRKKLTFDNSGQTEDLTSFAVMVNLSSSNFVYSKAKTDGTDLRFIDSDGSTELDYHIEEWNSSGYSYIWVEVPQIDGSSSYDHIWMYYNNSAASYVQDIEGTYDVNFTAVWHLNETTGTHYDATSNNHDGTIQGGVTQDATGVVDGADDFDGDADYIVVPTTSALNITTQITIEAWVKPDGIDHTDLDLSVVSKFDNSDRAYQLGFNDDAGDGDDWDWRLSSDGSTSDGQIHVSNAVDNNVWQYMVGTWDGSTIRLYKNAQEIGSSVSWSGPIYQSAADVWIGDGTYFGSMDGWIDEVRISNKGRSEDWITAQYLSMSDDFIFYGSEESPSMAEGFGRAYIFFGDGSIPTTAASADKNYTGEYIGDQFGFAVSDAGDVDNNGNDDVIIGAPFNDDSGTDAGKVYIYFYGDSYAYVSSNITTYGVITDFNDAKSALDSGAYAILKEGSSGGSGGNEYLYVDGFGSERLDWTESGSSPYLDAVDGSNTISETTANNQEGDFTFTDTSVVGTFSSSQIELYSVQAGSGETIDVYIHDGTSWNNMGSITPDGSYSWKSIDTSSVLDTAAKIDAAKLYVVYQKSGPGSTVTIDASRIYWSATSNLLYQMDVEFNTTSVATGSSYELQLNYSVDGSETNFGVLVYDGSSWDDLGSQGDLSSTSFTLKNYALSSEHRLGSGYVRVRFIGRNETSDTVNSTLNIEYHRIKSSDSNIEFTGENAGDVFGYSVSNVSDINSDGTYDDVIVGAPFINDDWWNVSWRYRRKLTFNNGLQDETLQNFPVLINLSSSNFDYSNAKTDGTDLRFIDPDGSTEFKYHIEDWNSSSYSFVWVNVTSIDGSSNTDYMWMYYGNSDAADVQDITGTYDINYTGVWHLNESSGTPYDATQYDNDGTLYNSVTQGVSGQVDGAYDFAGSSGTDDYIDCGNDPSLYFDVNRNYTWSAWIYRHGNADWDVIFSKFTWTTSGIRVFVDTGSPAHIAAGDHNNVLIEGTTGINTNTWYYVVMTFNSSSPSVPKIYLNGNEEVTTGSTTYVSDSSIPFDIGYGNSLEDFDGVIDEVKVSNKLRSADWISAQYKSMSNTFISYGSEEDYNPGKVYIFYGGSSMDSTSDETFTGESDGDRFGYSVDFAGDVDGDGRDDVVVGAPYHDSTSYTDSGIVYVIKGSPSMDFIGRYEFDGSQSNEHLGWSVSFALDINDSSDDTALAGAPHRDDGSDTDCGKGYLLHISMPNVVINEIMFNPTGGPFDDDWGERKKITIHSSRVSGDLTDFPVLISTTDSDLKNKARSDGDDIIFVADDNETLLDHELEYYDSSTGELIAWVRLPFVSSTMDTVFYMYYNNSDAGNRENVEGVWTNGYVGVYHMVEDTGSIANSASDTNDGTRENTPTRDTGMIGYGQNFSGGGADDWFNLGDLGLCDGTNEDITMSLWMRVNDPSIETWGKVISKRNETETGYVYFLSFNDAVSDKLVYGAVNGDVTWPYPAVKNNNWTYVTLTYDGTDKYLFINDTIEASDSTGTGALWASTADVSIGARTNPAQNYAGIMDELRFSNVARSSDWVATEYANMNYPDTFYTINKEDINTSEWTYRKEITINYEQVSGDIDGFPMMIETTDSDLATYAQADGDDIIFTDWDGKSQLNHEIEFYSSSNGQLIAWVKLANVSSAIDSTIFMYYNNSDAANSEDEEAVFSNGYVGVYHMVEDTGSIANSASSTNDGSRQNSPTRTTGWIGYGQDFSGSGGNDRFNLGDMGLSVGVLENLTLSFWMYANDSIMDTWGRVILKRDDSDSNTLWGAYLDDDVTDKDLVFNTAGDTGAFEIGDSMWMYVSFTYDGSIKRHYQNGSQVRDDTGGTGPISTTISSAAVTIGGRDGTGQNYGGILDEVRISRITHSADWILTEFNNQYYPGSFYTFNDEDITPSDWSYRKSVTINSSEVTGDLFAFPIVVDLTDSDLANGARSDGYDIIFTDSGGISKLAHEIENYTSATGDLVAWVKIPRLSSSSDTTIYMYYGDASISSPTENSPSVWENNYLAVWHMNELGDGTAGEYDESTVNDYDGQGGTGASEMVPQRTWGKIDSGQKFDGFDDHINVSSMNPQDYHDFTVEAWYKSTNVSVSDDEYIFHHIERYYYGPGIHLGITDDNPEIKNRLRLVLYNNTENFKAYYGTSNITDQEFHYVVGMRDDETIRLYVDANEENNTNDRHDGVIMNVDSNMGPAIGDVPGETEQADGTLDEIRLSRAPRSWNWVNATYNNINDTASFLYTGSEETPPSTVSPESTTNYEWVELYNRGNSAVNLSGWYLTDNDGYKFNISGAGSIPAGGYLVCHLGQTGTNSSTDVYGYIDYESAFTIQPDASAGRDVYLDSSIGILNMGSSTTMNVYNVSSVYKRPLIQFDLSGLPTGNIKDAKVWLYRISGHATTGATVSLHRMTQSWTEGDGTVNSGANWGTYDGTNSWVTSGGDYDSTSYDTKTIVAGTNAWYYWNVTDLISDWKDGTYNNYGMIFEGSDGSETQDLVSSDNSDSSLYPKLIVNMTTTVPILGNSDDLSLVNDDSVIIDYVAWGEDPGSDDSTAVAWSQWTDGEYVDTSDLIENQTIGRDKDSNDTNLPADWEDGSGKADPYGVDRTDSNGPTPNAQNTDLVIPEFREITIPIFIITVLVAVWRKKTINSKSQREG